MAEHTQCAEWEKYGAKTARLSFRIDGEVKNFPYKKQKQKQKPKQGCDH